MKNPVSPYNRCQNSTPRPCPPLPPPHERLNTSWTCLASDQSVRGQPDFGEVAFADAPVDGVEPDCFRFAVHLGGGVGDGGSVVDVVRSRRPSCCVGRRRRP